MTAPRGWSEFDGRRQAANHGGKLGVRTGPEQLVEGTLKGVLIDLASDQEPLQDLDLTLPKLLGDRRLVDREPVIAQTRTLPSTVSAAPPGGSTRARSRRFAFRNHRMRGHMQRTRRISPAATALLLAFVAVTTPPLATAASLDVAVSGDPGLAGNHRCSLREAIAAVNSPGVRTPCGRADRSSNTIVLRAGRYRLSVTPSDTDDNRSGDLNITRARSLTIVGAGSATTVIDASGLGDRVLSIASGATVTLSQLAIHGGHAASGTAGAPGAGGVTCAPGAPATLGSSGGGILNAGALTLRTTVVSGDAAGSGGAGGAGGAQAGLAGCVGGAGGAGGNGGGIDNVGRLTLSDSTVRANTAGSGGPGGPGGVSAGTPGSGGSGGAGGLGGGVYNQGTLTVSGSFVAGNRAGAGGAGAPGSTGTLGTGSAGPGGPGGSGGGLFSALKAMTLVNSTLVENLAGGGGPGGQGGVGGSGGAAAVVHGASTIVNATIAHNAVGLGGSATTGQAMRGLGGGIFVLSAATIENSRLQNTIVASNTGEQCAGNVRGAITDGDHNLSFGDRTCPGKDANPKLGNPRDNGGPTETLALRRGSPAINRVPTKGANCPATDQRGVKRPQRGACDIGAFEDAVPEITILAPSDRGSYEHRSHVRARFRCSEGGIISAIAKCNATVRAGHPINTRSAGTKSFRVVAVDKTGHRSVKTVRYDVWAYVNPLSRVGGLGPFRIDMGVDYSGSGPLLALGDAKITFASNNDDGPPSCWGITCWPGGGAVVYRLLNGPFAGKYVYYAERVTVTVRTGQTVKAGQQIAIEHLGSPNIEIGWGSGRGPETLAIADGHQAGGDPGGWSAIEGRNFNDLLVRLGAPSGFLQPGVPSQSMPRGWPGLPGRVNSFLIPRSPVRIAEGAPPRLRLYGRSPSAK